MHTNSELVEGEISTEAYPKPVLRALTGLKPLTPMYIEAPGTIPGILVKVLNISSSQLYRPISEPRYLPFMKGNDAAAPTVDEDVYLPSPETNEEYRFI